LLVPSDAFQSKIEGGPLPNRYTTAALTQNDGKWVFARTEKAIASACRASRDSRSTGDEPSPRVSKRGT